MMLKRVALCACVAVSCADAQQRDAAVAPAQDSIGATVSADSVAQHVAFEPPALPDEGYDGTWPPEYTDTLVTENLGPPGGKVAIHDALMLEFEPAALDSVRLVTLLITRAPQHFEDFSRAWFRSEAPHIQWFANAWVGGSCPTKPVDVTVTVPPQFRDGYDIQAWSRFLTGNEMEVHDNYERLSDVALADDRSKVHFKILPDWFRPDTHECEAFMTITFARK